MSRSKNAQKLRTDFWLGSITRLDHLQLGADPEFFFSTPKNGFIRGAERVIPKDGIGTGSNGHSKAMFVLDGVQAELHPLPQTCRAYFGDDIRRCFLKLREAMKESEVKLKPDFSSVVRISRTELDKLSDQSKQFGCKPSNNVYKGEGLTVDIDASKCTKRWAAGHIHLGADDDEDTIRKALKNPQQLVPVLDILLGNTCVLLDRDPQMAERRKVYGRAGEYRTPEYGIEYRTLSNFWLRSYPLTSFVLNMARFCVALTMAGDNYVKALKSLVDMDDIEKAINTNDIDLAYKNFKKIITFFEAIDVADSYSNTIIYEPSNTSPFTYYCIEQFLFFASNGTDHWFDANVIEHWCNLGDGHHCGWETFMEKEVLPAYEKWVGNGKPSLGTSIL